MLDRATACVETLPPALCHAALKFRKFLLQRQLLVGIIFQENVNLATTHHFWQYLREMGMEATELIDFGTPRSVGGLEKQKRLPQPSPPCC